MAKYDIKSINYSTCGSGQNMFNIEYRYTVDTDMIRDMSQIPPDLSVPHTATFFGDCASVESMSRRYGENRSAFYDMDNGMIIHNLYSVGKSRLKNAAEKRGGGGENVDMYAPTISDDFLAACQAQDYAYCLTKGTASAPVGLAVRFNASTASDMSYRYVLSSRDLPVYLYPSVEDLTNDVAISTYHLYVTEKPELSSSRLESVFSPAWSLNGVKYSYLIEVPQSGVRNKYDDGYIKCSMAVTKTHHSNAYNMEISSDALDLDSCREYCGINTCGGIVYMTYRDNVRYVDADRAVTYCDNTGSEYDQLCVAVANRRLSATQPDDSYSYQHVEVVKSFGKWDNVNGANGAKHKSSMYSLVLNDTGLNESTINERIKAKLRQAITNNVYKIAEKICPANTQLFKVYFEGK